MSAWFETLRILVLIALRNLFASRVKTLIVGGIICFGAVLVVVGTSLLDSVNEGMKRSIVGSAGGHLQVYNSNSKDALALYGGMSGDPDLAPIEDFSAVKKALADVPNIKSVVPMGIAEAMASSGNDFDRALERLRDDVRRRLGGDDSAELQAEYQAHKDHVRRMATLLDADKANGLALLDEAAVDQQAMDDLARGASEQYWAQFDSAPLDSLEFLENKVAPQSLEGDMIWLRYIGTDLEAYRQGFDRFEIVEGEYVPPGQRGIVLGKLYCEDWLKLKIARRLDKIRDELTFNHKKIARNEELQRFVKENVSQVREIVVQLDSIKEGTAVERLQKALGTGERDLARLLAELLDTTDANFEQRYRIFYADIAPLVELYRVRVGDTLTIKAFTKSGYMKSVNVKVYGIGQFKGLEKSGFAGMMSLMDLMTFRDLYGYLTAEKAAEIRHLKESSGARAIRREDAEAELFGAGEAVVAQGHTGQFDEPELGPVERADLSNRVYTREELEQGVALNAAILLEDPSRLPQALQDVEAAMKRAELPIKVVDWQQAAGMVGQFITLLRLVLFAAVFIIFVIAVVIINNAMVMATLQRVKEIGTLRAVGAQRRFVLAMVGLETVVIGLLFGVIGSALGAAVVRLLGRVGIPATSQEAFFLFSGPRLHPYLSAANLVVAFVLILIVSVLSGFYPARLATRITPLEAMQSEE